jgi:hypothetical protein
MTAKDKLEGQRSCRPGFDRAPGTKNKFNAVNATALQRFWRDFLRDRYAGA